MVKIVISAATHTSLLMRTRPTTKLTLRHVSRALISLGRDAFFAGRENLTPALVVEPFYMKRPYAIKALGGTLRDSRL
jgi:hypothetical protein